MVEGAALEKQYRGNSIASSNLASSAKDIVLKRPVHLNTYIRLRGCFNLAQTVMELALAKYLSDRSFNLPGFII